MKVKNSDIVIQFRFRHPERAPILISFLFMSDDRPKKRVKRDHDRTAKGGVPQVPAPRQLLCPLFLLCYLNSSSLAKSVCGDVTADDRERRQFPQEGCRP